MRGLRNVKFSENKSSCFFVVKLRKIVNCWAQLSIRLIQKKNQSSLFIVYKTFTKLVSLAFAVFLMRGAPYRRVRVQEHVPELY